MEAVIPRQKVKVELILEENGGISIRAGTQDLGLVKTMIELAFADLIIRMSQKPSIVKGEI